MRFSAFTHCVMVALKLSHCRLYAFRKSFQGLHFEQARLNGLKSNLCSIKHAEITTESRRDVGEWIENFCLSFFARSGAKRDFVKAAVNNYKRDNGGKEMKTEMLDALKSTLSNSILAGQIIKLLEVYHDASFCDHLESDEMITKKRAADSSSLLRWMTKYETESQDVVTISCLLSKLNTAEERSQLIQQAHRILLSPGSFGFPHRTGLLIIIELDIVFQSASYDASSSTYSGARIESPEKSKTAYNQHQLSEWRQAVKDCGFELVKHRTLGTSMAGIQPASFQAFVFRKSTIGDDVPTLSQQDNYRCDLEGLFTKPKIWIPSDFVSSNPLPGLESIMPLNSEISNASESLISAEAVDEVKRSSNCTERLSQSSHGSAAAIPLPVAIIGGGLGGSALAISLQRRRIPVVVFEKDSSFAARRQGYALTMQQGTTTLRSLGLTAELAEAGVMSRAHVSLSHEGRVLGAYGVRTKDAASAYVPHRDISISATPPPALQNYMDDLSHRAVGEGLSSSSSVNEQWEAHHELTSATMKKQHQPTLTDKAQRKDEKEKFRRCNIHIPRQRLRELLLRELDPQCIQWNKRLLHFEHLSAAASGVSSGGCESSAAAAHGPIKDVSGYSGVRLHFADGTSFDASAVVAADGIHSIVRSQLERAWQNETTPLREETAGNIGSRLDAEERTSAVASGRLRYLGLMVVLGISPVLLRCEDGAADMSKDLGEGDIDKRPPPMVDLASARRQVQWLDGCTRVFTMPFDDRHTMWQLSFPMDEEEARALGADRAALRHAAMARVDNWHEPLRQLLAHTHEDDFSGHPVYDRDPPDPSMLERLAGSHSLVTLIGDAAHPMSPFKGQGANQALLDALSLSKSLASSDLLKQVAGRIPLCAALRSYENEMCTRSSIKVLKSRSAAAYLHSEAALAEGDITRAAAAEGANS